jgi:hypothetical protein
VGLVGSTWLHRLTVRTVLVDAVRDASRGAPLSPPTVVSMKCVGPSNSSAMSPSGRYTSTEK